MTEHEANVHLWTRCGGARIDTHEMDCEIAPDPNRTFRDCCTGNCRQDRDCHYAEPTRASSLIYWLLAVALLSALVFVMEAPDESAELIVEMLGVAG